jgi:hypothetical protein
MLPKEMNVRDRPQKNMKEKLVVILKRLSAKVEFTSALAVYSKSARLVTKSLDAHDQSSLQMNLRSHSPYVTSSLTRRWVCPL